jgi:APA family basic amino acid/polyamine antiporter
MWALYLNAVIAIAFLVLSFGSYLNRYFISGIAPVVAALVAIAALTLLNFGPAALVGKAETWLVGLKVFILLVMIGYGLAYIGDATFTPFVPKGPQSILSTTATLFLAYGGFNVVTNMAGSVRRPQRTIPLTIVLSVIISAVVYLGVVVALLASGRDTFGVAGLGEAAGALMGHWGALLVAFAACVSTLSGANGNLLGASDMAIRMVENRDLPGPFYILTGHAQPVASVVFVGVFATILLMTGEINSIVALTNVALIVAMLIISAAAFQLARTGWQGSGMRLPGGVLIPTLAFITMAAQLPSLGFHHVAIGFALILAGLLLSPQQRPRDTTAQIAHVRDQINRLGTPLYRALRR